MKNSNCLFVAITYGMNAPKWKKCTGRERAASARSSFGPPSLPARLVADQQLSALSAFSFAAYAARILFCELFHGVPVGRFFLKRFRSYGLLHPDSPPFSGM